MKQKVLLVDDDNESLLRSLGNSFSAESYEVVLAEDVEQAIEKSEAGEIELLLMKLDLRSGEGWEAIDEITEENPFLPIVVVTSQPGLRALANAAGACALVEEPVDVPALLQTIRELLVEPFQRRMERVFNRTTNFQKASPSSGVFRATGSSVPGLVTIAPRRNYAGDHTNEPTRRRFTEIDQICNPIKFNEPPLNQQLNEPFERVGKLVPKVTAAGARE